MSGAVWAGVLVQWNCSQIPYRNRKVFFPTFASLSFSKQSEDMLQTTAMPKSGKVQNGLDWKQILLCYYTDLSCIRAFGRYFVEK